MRDLTFKGIQPKHIPQKLAEGYGAIAHNLDLYDGTLKGLGAPVIVAGTHSPDGTRLDEPAATIYKAGATWVGWPTHTFVVPDTVGEHDWASFLYVQAGQLWWQSEQRLLEQCAPVLLGTCPPDTEPTAFTIPCTPCATSGEPRMPLACVVDASGPGAQPCLPATPHARLYVHTWTRDFPCCTARMEESAPSPPVVIDVLDGEAVMLRATAQAPPGVTGTRWYRGVVGTDGGLAWLHAGDDNGGRFIDDKRAIELGSPLTTADHYPPPGCPLEGVALLGNARVVVWAGKTLWASHDHAPGSFDLDRHVYRLPYDIVGAIGVTSMLEQAETFETHVVTTGKPYRLDNDTASMRVAVREVQAWQPCISAASLCDMHGRSGYASPYGFVRFSGEGVEVLSDVYWTDKEWQLIEPARMRAVFWHERLWLGWPDRKGFAIGMAPDDGARPRTLVSFDPRVSAWYARADVPLHLAGGPAAAVYEWGRGAPMTWVWRSSTHVSNDVWHPTTVKVVTGEGWTWHGQHEATLTFGEWVAQGRAEADFFVAHPQYAHLMPQLTGAASGGHLFVLYRGTREVFRRKVPNQRAVSMPRIARHTEWGYTISGREPVREVHLQERVPELATTGGQG